MEGGLAFVVLIGVSSLVVVIWSVIDAASRPDWAWMQSGQSKGLWIALPIVFLILCGVVGGILGLVYLLAIRPRVIAAEQQGGPYSGGYGGPPGGYGAPPPGGYGAPPPGPYGGGPQPPPPPSGPPTGPFGG
jgi:hypothetical protein